LEPAQLTVARTAFYTVYDLKIVFIISLVLFEVGSALCGAAPSMNSLIVGRVLAGIGGSGIYIGYDILALVQTPSLADLVHQHLELLLPLHFE
jgi:MFS family permease